MIAHPPRVALVDSRHAPSALGSIRLPDAIVASIVDALAERFKINTEAPGTAVGTAHGHAIAESAPLGITSTYLSPRKSPSVCPDRAADYPDATGTIECSRWTCPACGPRRRRRLLADLAAQVGEHPGHGVYAVLTRLPVDTAGGIDLPATMAMFENFHRRIRRRVGSYEYAITIERNPNPDAPGFHANLTGFARRAPGAALAAALQATWPSNAKATPLATGQYAHQTTREAAMATLAYAAKAASNPDTLADHISVNGNRMIFSHSHGLTPRGTIPPDPAGADILETQFAEPDSEPVPRDDEPAEPFSQPWEWADADDLDNGRLPRPPTAPPSDLAEREHRRRADRRRKRLATMAAEGVPGHRRDALEHSMEAEYRRARGLPPEPAPPTGQQQLQAAKAEAAKAARHRVRLRERRRQQRHALYTRWGRPMSEWGRLEQAAEARYQAEHAPRTFARPTYTPAPPDPAGVALVADLIAPSPGPEGGQSLS